MPNSTVCINCEEPTQGLYCHHCGQKQGINRLTWRNIFSDLQKRLLGFDNNFLRTVKDLTIRPHIVVKSSIEGIRVRYIGAVGYYFLMVTIYVLVVSFFDIDFAGMSSQFNQSINPDIGPSEAEIIRQFYTSITDYFRLLSFLMIPFFTAGIWLVFKNKGYNFLETSILNLYGYGHPIWLSIIFLLINKYFGEIISLSIITLSSSIYVIILVTLFYKGNKIWNFVKAFFGMVLGFLFFILAILFAIFITLTVNPDLLKAFSS